MIKKIFLSIAMFLVALLVLAQSDTATAVSHITGNAPTASIADTLQIITDANDTIQALAGSFQTDTKYAEMVTVDDETYILKGARAFRLDDFDDILDSAINRHTEFFDNSENEMLVPVVAICFGIPCFTLIVALVLLLIFFLKKTQARNEIIGKAIDANYPLPEAFFTNPSASQAFYNQEGDYISDQGQKPSMQHQAKLRRDPKNFSSAISLLAIGLALILFFTMIDRWPIAFLAGGIPFFLGIGKLIGYYYVPGFSADNNRKRGNGYEAPQPPYGNYPNRPYQNTPPANQYPGAYPPPFPPRHNDNASTPH